MEEVTEDNHWDTLIEQLQAHRESVGSPSYGEIADRIKQDRMDRGAPDYAAHIARSSVYDAFRMGRSRVNVPLVREIAQALGAKPEQVDVWIRACDKPVPGVSGATLAAIGEPSRRHVALLMLACLALNMLGRVFVDTLTLPLFLDMVGTAIAAIALGPWRGAAVGAATNILGAVISGWFSLPFMIVNVLGALIWGYGVRRTDMGRSLQRFFMLNVYTALACSALAVSLLFTLPLEHRKGGGNLITAAVQDAISNWYAATATGNVLMSLADKLLSGFIALAVVSALPVAFRAAFPLAQTLAHASEQAKVPSEPAKAPKV